MAWFGIVDLEDKVMKKTAKPRRILVIAALAGIMAGCGGGDWVEPWGSNHAHSFRPVYKIVYHDAVTHTEDHGHYEVVMVKGARYREESRIFHRVTCSCGWQGETDSFSKLDAVWETHVGEALGTGPDICYGYRSLPYIRREMVKLSDAVYEDTWVPKVVTVVDEEAYEEWVPEREECVCGAVRQ